ncbi:hypothetical protein Cgig2_002883 [Carnegiea gigantea]|uniref:PGG domain-containing protein n=1 Tax=Carnegiea gigantea TaxID=171969 RepID=A0A9Q1KPY9_9CARY|nr:hypothetical protein Cgig2_002883 [Carnegiea gigantea]
MTVEDMLYVYTNILVLTSEAKVDGCQGPVLMPLGKYKDLRKLTGAEFDSLRSSQDHEGNTPLHSALDNNNFGAAKFLLHWCLRSELMHEMSIINNKGQSVLNLLELLDNNTPYVKQLKDLASLAHKKIKEEAFGKKMMAENVYTEAVNGNMDYFFKQKLEEQDQDITFMRQVAPDGSNVLHIAIQHNRAEFAMKVMECYPHLIWERDYHGDTPLHTAAKLWAIDYSRLDHSHFEAQWETACRSYHDSPSEEGLLIIPPWRVKNSQGNVPLHEKANSPVDAFGFHLLTFDFEAAAYVNSVGDTPLHISAKESYSFFSLGDLDNNARSAIYVQDKEGLTPLLRAAKAGNHFEIYSILMSFPELVQVRDDRGRSLLHLLRVPENESSQNSAKELLNKVSALDTLQKTKDSDGNTPLHSAIQDNNSTGAKLIAERCVEVEDNRMARRQLVTRNNDGKSIMDLLASHDDAPTEVLRLLINKVHWGANVHGLHIGGDEWVRSGYGVCKSQIKDMANTLSVVAGLLATITFAAAFQVPGGFNGESGSPILLQRAAFKAFMIFNSFAMCGSMAVLPISHAQFEHAMCYYVKLTCCVSVLLWVELLQYNSHPEILGALALIRKMAN